MPRIKPLSYQNYYELVVMPTGVTLAQAGYNNVADSYFKLLTRLGSAAISCGHIGEIYSYTMNVFSLTSMYLVNVRPGEPNALQLRFTINQFLNADFP